MLTVPRLDLRDPCLELADSYRSLVAEFVERGEDRVPWVLDLPHDDFPAFVARLAAEARGEGLRDGFVAHSTYWLVRDGTTVVGVSNLRHELTDRLRIEGGHIGYGVRPSERRQGYATELLRRTLARAAEKGIERALVTCDRDNVGSVRAIIRNGGVLDGESFVSARDAMVQRYWVPTGELRRRSGGRV